MDEHENTQTRKTVKLKLPTPPGFKVTPANGAAPQLRDPLGGRDTDTGNLDILSTNTQTRKTVKLKPLTPLENHPLSLEAIGNAGTNTNSRKVVVLKPTPVRPALVPEADATAAEANDLNDDTVKVTKHPSAATIKLSPLSAPPAPAEEPIKKSLPTVKLNVAIPPPPQITPKAAPTPAPVQPASTEEETDTVSVAKTAPTPATPKPTLKMAIPPPPKLTPKLTPKPVAPPTATAAPQPAAPVAVSPPQPVSNGDNSDTIIVDKPVPVPVAPADGTANDDRTVKVQRPVKNIPPPPTVGNADDKPTIKLAPLKAAPPAPAPEEPVAEAPAVPQEEKSAPEPAPAVTEEAELAKGETASEEAEPEMEAEAELTDDEKPYEIHIPEEALHAEEKPSVAYFAMAVITLILLGGVAALNGLQYYQLFMQK